MLDKTKISNVPWRNGATIVYDPTGFALSRAELDATVLATVDSPAALGWGQKRRLRFDYYRPGEYYAGIVGKCLVDDAVWLDVGGGKNIFPGHGPLEQKVVARAARLVSVDPSENVLQNELADECRQSTIEDFVTSESFDLVTARMVVEHVQNPQAFMNAIFALLRPGGRFVVYTVGLWSMVTCISRVVPDGVHNPVKWLFWKSQQADTFPTAYKLNTRTALRKAAEGAGLEEEFFALIDDCSVFASFRQLGSLELSIWRILSTTPLPYPERNIVAVYTRK